MTDKVEVESNIPGLGGTYDDINLSTIHTGLQQLRYFKKMRSSRHSRELDWEIKLYEWILAQPDSKEKAKQYLNARQVSPEEGYMIEKRAAVKKLGWDIK